MNRKEYLLECLSEECNEVGQRVSKALRFGLTEVQDGQELTNAERIIEEMRDLICVYQILFNEGFLPAGNVTAKDVDNKLARIEKFMAISRREGTLID